ncbi:YjbQ family protein [Candidatus Bipolaricaulota bacterium]|nr:YjbQ family protein [Candidatus Bipolaricaulota bacterium]
MTQFSVISSRQEMCIEITERVSRIVRDSGVSEGMCLVSCPHTTAGLFANENADPDVIDDVLKALDDMVPRQGPWRHGEGNSPAHVKAILTGAALTVPISDGCVQLGRWQGLFLAEFDGPRKRVVSVQILS